MGGSDEPFLDFSAFRDPFGIQFIIFANVKPPNSDPCARVNNTSTGKSGRIVRLIKEIFETIHNYARYIKIYQNRLYFGIRKCQL